MTRSAEAVLDDPALPERVSVAELYRQMWHFAQGARVPLVLSSLMLVGSQLIKLLVPWFAAKAIDHLQHSSSTSGMRVALQWVAGIVGLYAACWLLHGPGRVIERSVAVRVHRAIADRLYLHLSRAPLAWHEAQHSAALAHRVSQASSALSNFTQSQFVYLQNAVNLVGPLLALALLSAWTGAIALAGFCLVALTIVGFDRALMRLATDENAAERRRSAAMIDSLGNVATVLSLRLGDATRRLLARRLDAVVAPLRRSIRLNEWKWCGVDLLTVTLSWGLVVVYAWQHGQGSALMLGGIFMVYQYAQQASGVIGSLASNLQNFARMRVDFASAAPIWVAPQRPDTPRPQTAPEAAGAPGWRRIDLCNLAYEHSVAAGADGQRAGLKHISLRLQAGERIALVGPSGSGKSTLLRLLAGLYAPSHGHIEVDGVVSLHRRDLGAFATLIPQESQIFEATVRENIGFDFGHSDAELRAAAHTASFDAVLQALPLGLDSPLAQAGANLSGGQRQRLGLARGVLAAQGSSVLLLDEPTSALDPLTEALVFDRLAAAFPGACVVASVHRMSLLDRFDRVVLLVGGQIVDSGTQAELLARQPLMREMMGMEPALLDERADMVDMANLADPPRATAA